MGLKPIRTYIATESEAFNCVHLKGVSSLWRWYLRAWSRTRPVVPLREEPSINFVQVYLTGAVLRTSTPTHVPTVSSSLISSSSSDPHEHPTILPHCASPNAGQSSIYGQWVPS